MTPPEYFLRAARVLVEVEVRGDGEAEGGEQGGGDQQLHLQHHLHLVLVHRHHLQADLLQQPPDNTRHTCQYSEDGCWLLTPAA